MSAGAGHRLNELLAEAGMPRLDERATEQVALYISLLLRWNARTNLTAIRDEETILRRHLVESVACARALPPRLGSLLDFGSGGGFPGLPITICRPEIAVTLAESQGKKASFLREAVRTLGLGAQVHAGRAETLATVFDCVTMRAVDRMEAAVGTAARLVADGGWLALMTTGADRARMMAAADESFLWREGVPLSGSEDRVLLLGERGGSVFHVEHR